MCMTDLEKIEDMYPELGFWGVEVKNPHYHGHIEGNDVYINLLQPDIDWLKTALHETTHYDFDYGDLSNQHRYRTMLAEGFARRQSEIELKKFLLN